MMIFDDDLSNTMQGIALVRFVILLKSQSNHDKFISNDFQIKIKLPTLKSDLLVVQSNQDKSTQRAQTPPRLKCQPKVIQASNPD